MRLTPARRRGVEILDDPSVDPPLRARSIRDVVVSNRLFGGLRAAMLALGECLRGLPDDATLLDVGSGLADIPAAARTLAARRGLGLTTIGVDEASTLLVAAAARLDERVCASAMALPFADASVDIVLASQLLHHFEHADAVRLLRELHRVARHHVVIADLRRSWVAAWSFRLAASALRFHPITRNDGYVSVLRGFTATELSAMIEEATGVRPTVRRRLGYRLTAVWQALGGVVRAPASSESSTLTP